MNWMNNRIYIFIFSFASCSAAETELTTYKTNYVEPQIIHNYLTEAIFSKDRLNNPEKYYLSLIALAKYRDLQGTKAPYGIHVLAEYYIREWKNRSWRQNVRTEMPLIDMFIRFPYSHFYDAFFSEDIRQIHNVYELALETYAGIKELGNAIHPMACLATHIFDDTTSEIIAYQPWSRFQLEVCIEIDKWHPQ